MTASRTTVTIATEVIAGIVDTLRQLMSPTTAKRRIGFVIDDEK